MAIEQDMKLLTASDVAELCEVDLKTIHNWVERGCIPHFRTPGRHLRFQAADVARFLREWGYAIPRRFYAEIAQIVVVLGSKDVAAFVQKAAGATAVVHCLDDPYAALLHLGFEPATAVVIDGSYAKDNSDWIERAIAALSRAFSSLPIHLVGDDELRLHERHPIRLVPVGDLKAMRTALIGDPADQEQPPSSGSSKRAKRRLRLPPA